MGDNETNAKNKQGVEQQCYAFDDLIFEEILLKLPVKSLIRFKSVSKQWYSIISSSKFAITQFMKSPFSHPAAPVDTLFIKSRNNYYLFSYDDNDQTSGNFEDNLVKLGDEFGLENAYIILTGSCNGLICLTPRNGHYFIIWNPTTRKTHKYELDRRLPSFDVSGFGYASSVDDYKYVRISTVRNEIIVRIFSLKENKWRKLYFDRQDARCFHGEAMLVNETLYWYARLDNHHASCIVSFDIGAQRINIIKSSYLIYGDMGGCLSMYNRNEKFTSDNLIHIVPIVEPHAIGKSIDVPKGLIVNEYSQMIGFTRTDKFFMTGPPSREARFESTQALGIVDTGTKLIQYTRLLRFHGYINIARYVPSLVSPFLTEEPSKT